MAQRPRLTNNSDETDIDSLLSGDAIFAIPYFQRPYKWKKERLDQLNADILDLVDDTVDMHFLGAVIVHGHRTNPAQPKLFDVIDGQQRITTMFLYLCAIVKILCDLEQFTEAKALFLKYLVINRDTGATSNIKLHPCKEDRAQLNRVFVDLFANARFQDALDGFKPRYLPSSGLEQGVLVKNFRSAFAFMKEQYNAEGLERIRDIYSFMLNNMSVVQIDVWDPINGPKIFDSLNSRQEPMTTGDLVRNEIFSRIANHDALEIELIDNEQWQPFYKKFDQNGHNLFDAYFFPYGLIINPNLKKSDVFGSLKKDWEDLDDPASIIQELAIYQDAFIDLNYGTNLCGHPNNFASAIWRLHAAKSPSATFPFLMLLSQAVRAGEVNVDYATDILDVLETFLVRRAVCGHEPTGLHAVFKRLWADCENEITKNRVITEISKHRTVVWPNNEDFASAIQTRSLYGVGITNFVLLEYEGSHKGDSAPGVEVWIEHVLPENPHSDWFNDFTKQEHIQYKDRLANLLPLSRKMNIEVSNRPYVEKRPHYQDESIFKSTRKFAKTFEYWTPTELLERGAQLASWAIERWPYEASQS